MIHKKLYYIFCVLFVLGIAIWVGGCGKSKAKSKDAEIPPPKAVIAASQTANTVPVSADLTMDLPPNEYGREHPFMPLIATSKNRGSTSSVVIKSPPGDFVKMISETLGAVGGAVEPKSKTSIGKQSAETPNTLSLTAIISENMAIFKDAFGSQSVAKNEVINGMTLLEIQNNEVTLGLGDKKIKIAVGGSLNLDQLTTNDHPVDPGKLTKNGKAKVK